MMSSECGNYMSNPACPPESYIPALWRECPECGCDCVADASKHDNTYASFMCPDCGNVFDTVELEDINGG